MLYKNISELLKDLRADAGAVSEKKKYEYSQHLDEYVFPQMLKIYNTINSKVEEKVRYKGGRLDDEIVEVYSLFCIIFEKNSGEKITCQNAIFNDLEKWFSKFDKYVF